LVVIVRIDAIIVADNVAVSGPGQAGGSRNAAGQVGRRRLGETVRYGGRDGGCTGSCSGCCGRQGKGRRAG
jgi:hypothetical protein